MNRTIAIVGALALILAGGAVGLVLWLNSGENEGTGTKIAAAPLVNCPPPLFAAKTFGGGEIDLKEHLGKRPVIVHFWRRGCSALCTQTLKIMSDFYRNTNKNGEKKIEIIMVDVRDSEQEIADYFKAEKISMACPTALDSDSRLEKLYDISRAPTTFIIDRDGVIRVKIIPGDFGNARDFERLLIPYM